MAKGEVAAKAPIKVEVEAGKDYWWCSCGRSSNQPFCDGSHQGSEFSPMQWTAEESGEKWFCACKQTDGEPFCDGSHNALEAKEEAAVVIEQRVDGPLVVKNLSKLIGPDGEEIECKPVMALCRCGQSKNKPFCDGTHNDAGFKSTPGDVVRKDRIIAYEGREITVHYNPLVCSHAAECVSRMPGVFDPNRKPWIEPDSGDAESIKATVGACPSGALRYSEPAGEPQHLCGDQVAIRIERNGAYKVENVQIAEDVRWAEGTTKDKFVLCRCGLSSNKPFCDGTHYDENWRD